MKTKHGSMHRMMRHALQVQHLDTLRYSVSAPDNRGVDGSTTTRQKKKFEFDNSATEEILRRYFAPTGTDSTESEYLTTTEICERLRAVETALDDNYAMLRRVGIALKSLGFKRVHKRGEDGSRWRYEVTAGDMN